MLETIETLEAGFLLYIQEAIRIPELDFVITFITSMGNGGLIWLLACGVLYVRKDTRVIGIMGVTALLSMLLINNGIIKNLVGRPRPFDVIEGLQPLIAVPKDYSFPSGHACSSFAVATVLFRNLPKKIGAWWLIIAIIIGLSRLYVGVHYPTDVLAGALLGMVIGIGAEVIVKRLLQKKRNKRELKEEEK